LREGWRIDLSFDGQLSQEYLYQKLLKSVNPSSSYNQKPSGCFFSETQCILVYSVCYCFAFTALLVSIFSVDRGYEMHQFT